MNDQNSASAPVQSQSDLDLVVATRRLIAIVHRHANPDESNQDAIGFIDEAIARLENGPTRSRWYEDAGATMRHRNLSAFSGSLNPLAPPMKIRVDDYDGRPCLLGEVRIEREREGPPGCVHGGVIAGLFDELAGAAQSLTGRSGGVTGRLTVRYRKPTPLGADLTFRAYVADERARRVVIRANCMVDGEISAEAEALFLRVPWLGASRVAEQP